MCQLIKDAKHLASLMDSSLLRATNRESEYEKLCVDAIKYGYAVVAVNGSFVSYCAKLLKGSGIGITVANSFPLGLCSTKTKLQEASNAFEDGATDVDCIMNISKIKDHDWKYVEYEMKAIVDLAKQEKKISKIIFENCYLTKEEIAEMCRISNATGPDFIKTATGTQGPALVEDVQLMRRIADPAIKVKASGGVHNLEKVKIFLEAGAERMGTITATDIMVEYFAEQGIKEY